MVVGGLEWLATKQKYVLKNVIYNDLIQHSHCKKISGEIGIVKVTAYS